MSLPQLDISDLITPATQVQWLAQMLANDATVGLQTTSWQSGGMARTILTVMSYVMPQEDGLISQVAQGGFLDFAASGTVTYQTASGATVTIPVTPDPSIPSQNPNGTPGWLDVTADGLYNLQRYSSAAAAQDIALVNTDSTTLTYPVGTYHVSDPSTGNNFTNAAAISLPTSGTIGGSVVGATNATPIAITTSGAHGLVNGSQVYITGVNGNAAANGFWTVTVTGANSFTLAGVTGNSMGSGSYTSGGTVYTVSLFAFVADIAGVLPGTSAAGAITNTITANAGVFCFNFANFVGVNWESNAQLAARCRLAIQAISPGGPKGAAEYFAETAGVFLAAMSPALSLSNPITRTLVSRNYVTGVVTVYVANQFGGVAGCAQLAITGATNATPIAITTASAHGLTSGEFAIISGVLGNLAANGSWTITVTGASTFTLNTSVGNGAYTTGGSTEGGDLGLVDSIVQANAVPDLGTYVTASATATTVTFAATVAVPQAQIATYTTIANAAVTAYLNNFSIGGSSNNGFVYINDLIGILYASALTNGQPTYNPKITSVLLNGVAADYAFTSPIEVLVPAITLKVQGV